MKNNIKSLEGLSGDIWLKRNITKDSSQRLNIPFYWKLCTGLQQEIEQAVKLQEQRRIADVYLHDDCTWPSLKLGDLWSIYGSCNECQFTWESLRL